ncbi:MAG TPA: PAS domain-containing sensor histidine kinase [Ramlibacter sp.]|nr:PAS domain-containing sensor histidine kinase [Ramlibacter sp.]
MSPSNADPSADAAARLGRVLATTQDYAVILLDAQGVIVDWLGACENVLGYTAQEALGQPFGFIFTPEDRDGALDRQELEVARASGRSRDERWHLRKGGLRFWGSGILHGLRDDTGTLTGYCKVLRDRTDVRTLLDEQQHRIDTQAQELERRRRFMVRLGHELRNPLAPIRAAAYTIQRVGDEKVKRPCEVLERQVEVMVRLLDDLTEATRADAHVSRILPQKVVLQEAVQMAAGGLQAAAEAKNQALAVVLPEVPITLEADPARLQQMLLNLLGNAVKYTPEGGHVTITASIEGTQVAIHVEDDGAGIPQELLPHLFELFARGTRTAAFEDGLGVGLAVVKELAALHGGSITVRTGVERGSAFTLRLPLVQPAMPASDLP